MKKKASAKGAANTTSSSFTTGSVKQNLINAFMDFLSTTNETCKKSATNATTTNRLKSGQKRSSAKFSVLSRGLKPTSCVSCEHMTTGDIPDKPACVIFMLYVPDEASCFTVNSIRQKPVKYCCKDLPPLVTVEAESWTKN
jgi:hypothetical protein